MSHAYILAATEGADREAAARQLASALLCGAPDAPCGRCRDCRKCAAGVHPDMIWVRRQKDDKGQLRRELLVEQIRDVAADAAVAPNESDRKVYIIPEAERMNIPAQNALLKALEDPPGHACFILCTDASADALLPTVRSRCVSKALRGAEGGADSPLAPFAREYLGLAGKNERGELLLFCMNRTKLSREEALDFLDAVRTALGEAAAGRSPVPGLDGAGILRLSALADRAERMLRRYLSVKQVFGVLAAETPR